MFDIGIWELTIIGVVALLVIGPERLPEASRSAGRWAGKIRRTVSSLRAEIEREIDLPKVDIPGVELNKLDLPKGLDDLDRMLNTEESNTARQQQDTTSDKENTHE